MLKKEDQDEIFDGRQNSGSSAIVSNESSGGDGGEPKKQSSEEGQFELLLDGKQISPRVNDRKKKSKVNVDIVEEVSSKTGKTKAS